MTWTNEPGMQFFLVDHLEYRRARGARAIPRGVPLAPWRGTSSKASISRVPRGLFSALVRPTGRSPIPLGYGMNFSCARARAPWGELGKSYIQIDLTPAWASRSCAGRVEMGS